MNTIIKKLNKLKVNFQIKGDTIFFNREYDHFSITKINNNKYYITNAADSMYVTYKYLIRTLNKYTFSKKWGE